MTHMDRAEYGLLYRRTFGKNMRRQNCRDGWERWQTVLQSGASGILIHPPGEAPPDAADDDYHLVATCGQLRFLARTPSRYFRQLPEQWEMFSRNAPPELKSLGQNPRARARGFLHNSLVDGYITDPVIGPLMASAIAWLVTTSEAVGSSADQFHLLGFDIAYVPGPAGQSHNMFNFRLLMSMCNGDVEAALDATFDAAHAMPLPGWQPPPH